ncbi:hypothetical protein MNBD_GAMMA03-1694 [hydrothermal vent metagenome]|uniref:DUF2934 domain-containing protein n=1 Tax=hydrothermal vent metagenome TaxID=652676 RepID=A0A3B0WAM1_9ZZZZ
MAKVGSKKVSAGRSKVTKAVKAVAPRRAKRTTVKKTAFKQDELWMRTEKKAYELFELRGYSHGSDFDDWLEAEKLVLTEV